MEAREAAAFWGKDRGDSGADHRVAHAHDVNAVRRTDGCQRDAL